MFPTLLQRLVTGPAPHPAGKPAEKSGAGKPQTEEPDNPPGEPVPVPVMALPPAPDPQQEAPVEDIAAAEGAKPWRSQSERSPDGAALPKKIAPILAPPVAGTALEARAIEPNSALAKPLAGDPSPAVPVPAARTGQDAASGVGKMPAAPEGVEVRAIPADAGAALAAGPATSPMSTVERVLASASAVWRPQEFVRQEAVGKDVTPADAPAHKPARQPVTEATSFPQSGAPMPGPGPAMPEIIAPQTQNVTAPVPPRAERLRRAMDPIIPPAGVAQEPRHLDGVEIEFTSPPLEGPEPTPPPAISPAWPDAGNHAPAELAFALHLEPLPGNAAGEPAAVARMAAEPVPAPAPIRPNAPGSAVPAIAPPKSRKPGEVEAANAGPPPSAAAKPVLPSVENVVPRERPPEISLTEPVKTARSSEPTAMEPAAALKARAPARDIKLEVAGGEQRVEVRLTERGGEVRVAVRTADSHLAGTLRENLPGLSSRLVESGFRAEGWHPAATGTGEWRRASETSAGNLDQNSNPQSGGQDGGQHPDDADSRRPRTPQEQIERKEKGKDFAWLMSSLQ